MKKTILGLAALTALAFVACKKNNDSSPAQKIIGKWQLVNDVTKVTSKSTGQVTRNDTTTYSIDSYIDFRTDGYAYSYANEGYDISRDTVKYMVSGSLLISGTSAQGFDTVTIKTLTDNVLSIYSKEDGPYNTYEWTENAKK
ncbi:hypothetical protein [Pinibacter aurantiacus]|uniref:Lipocalin-like domain-containing protein n=1 Tax=Pinibacter aurantiacus TaxID=2851599 RepID=A0A9E2W3U9_9BACT|nr:hypothetical protein [Pinibacter aurantiacus]MBV4357199.1 hypothetical protein [Pinibacter aurantiacus]